MKQHRYIIGIGAQKSGTSWLADYLSEHPEVFMSPIKELHFFDSLYKPNLCPGFDKKRINSLMTIAHSLREADIAKETARFRKFNKIYERVRIRDDIRLYREYFARQAGDESVFCEISPSYALINRQGFKAMKSLADDVRLIYLLRNPIDRFWSEVRMWAKNHPDTNVIDKFENFIDSPNATLRSEYNQSLATVYSVFPKEKVFVQFYEHLFNLDVIAHLCDFCGIGFVPPDTEKRVWEGTPSPMTDEMRARVYQKLGHVYDWAEDEFGATLPQSWQADIAAFRQA
ncbi:MAG: sulfotransferase [Methylovulum sp.]|nr:sulfotransferase [Methylovulum sp.]